MNISLKKALATPCKCGGMPKLSNDFLYNGGLWLLVCDKCGEESLAGSSRYYATNTWYYKNKRAK